MLYKENPKDSINRLLVPINIFHKVAGYKINTQKLDVFLCYQKENEENTPLIIASKIIKIPRNKFNQKSERPTTYVLKAIKH